MADLDLFARDIAGWSAALAAGETTSVELTNACLSRVATHDRDIRAFTTLTAVSAREAAGEADARRDAGTARGPLDGIPVALKDNVDLAGTPATAGMATREGIISEDDAVVTRLLREAGAVILGKVNMHEGALGATNESPLYGRTYNPHRSGYTPGGSSGGSGAAVAAGFCCAALGTDTLGSVRLPAAYCGVTGIKPTRGLVSPRGVVPLSWTLDHVGPLARSVRDLGLLLDVIAGYDPLCAESVAAPVGAPYDPGDAGHLTGVRLGRLDSLDGLEVDGNIAADLDRAIQVLTDLGAEIVPISLAGYDYSRLRRAGLLISEAEGAVVHAADLAERPDLLSDTFRAMLSFGAGLPATRLIQAHRDIAAARILVAEALQGLDGLVLPTAPQTAFDFADEVPVTQADLTSIGNLTDRPAVSVPMGFSTAGLPMGLQFVGHRFGEAAILRYARAYERAAAHDMRPRTLI